MAERVESRLGTLCLKIMLYDHCTFHSTKGYQEDFSKPSSNLTWHDKVSCSEILHLGRQADVSTQMICSLHPDARHHTGCHHKTCLTCTFG